jgi:hypothetical protein
VNWTPTLDNRIRTLFAEGKAYKAIAAAMGPEFTPGMVIGRGARMDPPLPKRVLARQSVTVRKPKRVFAYAKKPPSVKAQQPKVIPVPADCKPISLMARTDHDCAYPVKAFAGPDKPFYCGLPTETGNHYCPYHTRVVWVSKSAA